VPPRAPISSYRMVK